MNASCWLSDSLNQNYTQIVDDKPIHIYYERPNLWSLMPQNLLNINVLDLGCGSGWYAEQILKAGGKLTAIDISPTFVDLTRQRTCNMGQYHIADLNKPLDFLGGQKFDVIIAPLVIHYINDLKSFFAEVSKLLISGGKFIFSTHHPHAQAHIFKLKNYFDKIFIKDEWQDIGKVSFYHHSMHSLFCALTNNGFLISQLLEPQPLAELKDHDPTLWENLTTSPWFLFIQALKLDHSL